MTAEEQKVIIEYEKEDDDNQPKNESILEIDKLAAKKPTVASDNIAPNNPAKIVIPRKKPSELTEQERAQLVADAQQGIDNEFYTVKLFKNGSTRITPKKQTKAQELIKANEQLATPAASTAQAPATRYLTDNQLLFEHVINLETQYSKLRAKHKKLKKRYNELEGYLYAEDSDDEARAEAPAPTPKAAPMAQASPASTTTGEAQAGVFSQPQYIQRRYVRSWRDLRPPQ